jgi:hypothetical protein
MAEVVVATLNVNFAEDTTADTTGVLKLEIDDREDGLNAGDTSFQPGDTVGFFLFKDSNVTVEYGPSATSGGITASGSASKDIDEYITFSNSDSGSLGYPPSGSVSLEWQGKCLKIVGTEVTQTTALPERTRSNLKMANGSSVAGVLRARYSTTGSLYTLRSVPKDITEVLIIAIGSVA